MDDESGESIETMEEVPLKELGENWPSNRGHVQGSRRSVQLLPGTRLLVH